MEIKAYTKVGCKFCGNLIELFERAGVETAAVKKFAPSRYEDAIPCVYQLVTKVVPRNQPPIDR